MNIGDLVKHNDEIYIIESILYGEFKDDAVIQIKDRSGKIKATYENLISVIDVPDMYIEKKTPVRFQFSGVVGQLYEALETLDIKELLVEFLFNSKEYYADKGMDYFESWLIDKGLLSDFSQDELLVDFGYDLPF